MRLLYVFILLCLISFVACSSYLQTCLGVCNGHLVGCLSYQIAHISVLHLLINMFSLIILFKNVADLYHIKYYCNEKLSFFTSDVVLFIVVYIGSVLSGIICACDVPTLGASGMVFFLLGVLIMLNPTKAQVLNYLWVVVAVFIQWYFGKSNVALHLVSFVEGSLFVIVKESTKRFYEYRGLYTKE